MADWYGTSRTNYFKVKDAEKFKAHMKDLGVEVMESEGTHYAVTPGPMNGNGDWPSEHFADDSQQIELDFFDILCEHIQDGECVVAITVGNEKIRYLSGWATAFTNNPDQESVSVCLDNIYDMAKDAFGIKPSRAEC